MSSCEMCGRESMLMKAKVEKVLMSVCKSCSRFGNVVLIQDKISSRERKQKVSLKMEKDVNDVVADYSERIRQGREKLKLTPKDLGKKLSEKVSVIHKLETHKMIPSFKLAKKLEGYLNIKLIGKLENSEDVSINFKEEKLTIGDLIKVKKK